MRRQLRRQDGEMARWQEEDNPRDKDGLDVVNALAVRLAKPPRFNTISPIGRPGLVWPRPHLASSLTDGQRTTDSGQRTEGRRFDSG